MSVRDITVTKLARIKTEGGDVLHALKQSDAGFSGFGEVYFSNVNFGAVKAWKRHKRMTMNLVVPVGKVRFVFYDVDLDSFKEELIGEDNYVRLTVPPGIWFGFQGVSRAQNLVLNIASIPHDPTEAERCDITKFKFDWK